MSSDRYTLKKRRGKLGLTQQEVADKAAIKLTQYQRFETGERELGSASFSVAYRILKALEMDIDRYVAGDYEVREILYRGGDGRLYNYETDEPVEVQDAGGGDQK